MRKPLVCANWKMNHTLDEGINFFEKLETSPLQIAVDVVIFPTFPLIKPLLKLSERFGIPIGAQNLNENTAGAFTGEISASILKSCGATWVIIGHSERRDIYGETDSLVVKKIHAALGERLDVVLCVGEHLETREKGEAMGHVKNQLEIDLGDIQKGDMRKITIAYEPIWAIGTGMASTPDDAEEMMSFIRNWVGEKFNSDISTKTRILYGGSVKPDNMKDYAAMENIDGALVGGASLDSHSFQRIMQAAIVNQ